VALGLVQTITRRMPNGNLFQGVVFIHNP
jgi:hypothetical protein